jgi:hypothetical protein
MNDCLIYLDPHFVQETVPREKLREKMGTYFCDNIRYLNFNEIDTSVGLCFLIKDENDFHQFIMNFKTLAKKDYSFLGVEINMPAENINDVESVDSDDFEKFHQKQEVDQF